MAPPLIIRDIIEYKKMDKQLKEACEDCEYLKKINRYLVGRELRIAELKRKIERLESRNNNEN